MIDATVNADMTGDVDLLKWAEDCGGFGGHHFFKTSGSSGEEKWVALSNEALEWSARSVIQALEITPDDILGLALPEYHVGGYGLVLRAQLSGAGLVRRSAKWHPREFSDWCLAEGVTITSLVPTQVYDLVSGAFRGADSLRKIVVGGGAFDPGLCNEARSLGWPVLPSYGMTETSSQVATGDGLPLLPGWEARIEDRRLALKGKGLLTAIIRRSGDCFESHDPKIGGWYLTNDRAEIVASGLKILGRADRLVKVLGELVDLDGLEKFWKESLQTEVAIISRHDERRGALLQMFFEGEGEGVESFNADRPGLERLSGWQRVDQLPRSALGKIDRAALGKIDCD